MKKILAFVSLMAFALACAAPPTNRDLATNATRETNAAEKPSMMMTEADAIAKEKAIWETIRIKDYDAFASMLDANQVEVLDVAVHDKAASIAGVKDFEPSEVVFSDWKYLPIDKDAFVVIYGVTTKGKYKGKDFGPDSVRGSSAWVNRDGKWLAIFHQECPVKPPMPAPKPGGPAKSIASPSIAPVAAATGSDPVANEKLVWDLFKAKNYDAFAALLAPDFLEVEPDNVYDKAASVKGVSQFDASKSVLSDFKSVSLDADAALVTYVVTGASFSPAAERHSTIWVKREGKWLGLFHHGGTPVVKMPAAQTASSPAAK